jgi:large subunit ribosomal protein L10
MPTERKNQSIEELRARIAATPNVVLTDYRGLTVGELRTLRSALRKQSSTFAVIKNTLFGIALGDERRGQLAALLQGPTGVAFAGGDIAAVAKALVQFANESKKLHIKAGLIDGQIYDAAKIDALSRVPSRPELLSKLVGSLHAPLHGLVGVLHGNKRKLVQLLSAIHAKKSEAGGEPAPA